MNTNHLDSLLHKPASTDQSFTSDRYHFKAQLFLDVNPAGDSILHFSASVFDVFGSYYNLPSDSSTDCFMNIYFDLCEIERRKMELVMNSHSWNAVQLDSIYQRATENFDKQSELYLKEVQAGKNKKESDKWNRYVLENLGIDNKKIFGLTGF